jgi:uncharacterized ion transporter superfamily protein YfcC
VSFDWWLAEILAWYLSIGLLIGVIAAWGLTSLDKARRPVWYRIFRMCAVCALLWLPWVVSWMRKKLNT